MGLIAYKGRADFGGPGTCLSSSAAAASNDASAGSGQMPLSQSGSMRWVSTSLGNKAAVPSGYREGGAWVLPLSPGELASTIAIAGTSGLDPLNLAGGLGAESALSGAGGLVAMGELIVSAVATLSGLGDLFPSVRGKLEASASLAGSGSISGALAALAGAVCEIVGTGSAAVTARANGNISADLTPFTELSPQSMAAAVWNSLVNDFQSAGTMGLLLGEAGGGSSPSTIADAVWDELASGHTAADSFGAIVGQDIYTAKVLLLDDDSGSADRYIVSWFKNGSVVTSGVTSPTLAVLKISDGTDLITASAMSEIGSTGRFKFETSSTRTVAGAGYLAVASATIDGTVRSWDQPVGRDG